MASFVAGSESSVRLLNAASMVGRRWGSRVFMRAAVSGGGVYLCDPARAWQRSVVDPARKHDRAAADLERRRRQLRRRLRGDEHGRNDERGLERVLVPFDRAVAAHRDDDRLAFATNGVDKDL